MTDDPSTMDDMSDKDRSEQAIEQLLDGYSKLVAMAVDAVGKQQKTRHVTETIDGMSDRHAKAVLNLRVTLDALEMVERNKAAEMAEHASKN